MTGTDIAALIAASAFAVLVVVLAVPLWKLGRTFDETTAAVRALSDTVTPLLEEATGNISALVALFAASVGGPLIKVAAFSAGVRAAIGGLPGIGPRRATK